MSHEISLKLLTGAAVTSRLGWGWRNCCETHSCGFWQASVPCYESSCHGPLHQTAHKIRPCFLQRQWSKKGRIQDESHCHLYLNLRSDIPSSLLYFISSMDQPRNSVGEKYTKVWTPQVRDHWRPPLGTGYHRYHELKHLGGTSCWGGL